MYFFASGCLCSLCKTLSDADLYQPLDYLKTHIQNEANIFFHTTKFIKISLMICLNIIDQCGKIRKTYRRFQIFMCFSLLYTGFQSVLEHFLIMVMLSKCARICLIMRKGKIIRHIVDHFAEPTPVNSLVALIQSDIRQFSHSSLDILKCSVELMSLSNERRLDIRQNAAQAESLSVRLQACCGLHLIRKIPC